MMAGYLPSGSGHKPPNLSKELEAVGGGGAVVRGPVLLNGQHMGPALTEQSVTLPVYS